MKGGQKKFWVSKNKKMLSTKGCRVNTPKCSKDVWQKVGQYKVLPPCCIKHLREILFYLHDLFEEEHIHYWLDFGTLLGAIRTGSHIPHDSDGDLGLFLHERKHILSLKKKIEKDGFWMIIHKSKNSEEATIHGHTVIRIARSTINHMTVDLFFWKLNAYDRTLTSDGLNLHKSFPDIFVQGRKEVVMYGRKLWGPNHPKEFLRFRYGHDWYIEKKKKVNFGFADETHRGIFDYGKQLSNTLKLV